MCVNFEKPYEGEDPREVWVLKFRVGSFLSPVYRGSHVRYRMDFRYFKSCFCYLEDRPGGEHQCGFHAYVNREDAEEERDWLGQEGLAYKGVVVVRAEMRGIEKEGRDATHSSYKDDPYDSSRPPVLVGKEITFLEIVS